MINDSSVVRYGPTVNGDSVFGGWRKGETGPKRVSVALVDIRTVETRRVDPRRTTGFALLGVSVGVLVAVVVLPLLGIIGLGGAGT